MQQTFLTDDMARLAKGKGFDWACDHYYYDDGYGGALRLADSHYGVDTLKNSDLYKGNPKYNTIESMTTTPDDLQRWLRQEHDLHLAILRRYPARTLTMAPLAYYAYNGQGFHEDLSLLAGQPIEGYSTYEEAQLAGLKLRLNSLPDTYRTT